MQPIVTITPGFDAHSHIYHRIDRFAREHPLQLAAISAVGILFPPVAIVGGYFLAKNWSHTLDHWRFQVKGWDYRTVAMATDLIERTAKSSDGRTLAQLRINKGGVPILSFTELCTPYMHGYIKGRLLADQIEQIVTRVFTPLINTIENTLDSDQTHSLLETKLASAHFSPEINKELEGVVEGVRTSLAEQGLMLPDNWLHTMKVAHALIDIVKSPPPETTSLECCSVVVLRDDNTGKMAVARNFDFYSIGLLGNIQLIEEYTSQTGRVVHNFTFPGYLGAYSIWTDDLLLFINVMGYHSLEFGTPAVLLVREIAEQCGSLDEVEAYIKQNPCLGSITLTAVDSDSAKVFHFYPHGDEEIVVRSLEEENPLIATNSAYSSGCDVPVKGTETKTSDTRVCDMRRCWEEFKDGETTLTKQATKMVHVAGKVHTLSTLVFDNDMKVEKIVYDNYYAFRHL